MCTYIHIHVHIYLYICIDSFVAQIIRAFLHLSPHYIVLVEQGIHSHVCSSAMSKPIIKTASKSRGSKLAGTKIALLKSQKKVLLAHARAQDSKQADDLEIDLDLAAMDTLEKTIYNYYWLSYSFCNHADDKM